MITGNSAVIIKTLVIMLVAFTLGGCHGQMASLAVPEEAPSRVEVSIDSLASLTTPVLRARSYGSRLQIVAGSDVTGSVAPVSGSASRQRDTMMATYESEGLRLYTRIDIPSSPMPTAGFPVVIFLHGWVGRENAPGYNFAYPDTAAIAGLIDAYVNAGFVVFLPGLRGHGTVAGTPAEGIEFLDAWDNGSYLSPIFYAMDVLNLLDSIQTLPAALGQRGGGVRLDLTNINLAAWSQGGDVALTVLAVSGEGSAVKNALRAGSIWAGCFAPRLTQLQVYGAMATTPEAFMAGDGTWTGSAVGRDGSVNPNFVFGYPSDWIATMDRAQWSWQNESWSLPGVAQAWDKKLREMYDAVNLYVRDMDAATYRFETDPAGQVRVEHDPRLLAAMPQIGGYDFASLLTEPINLHHSDRDYYSFPAWNADLARRANSAGGQITDFIYPGTTHALRKSPYPWFSPPGTVDGVDTMLARDLKLFSVKE